MSRAKMGGGGSCVSFRFFCWSFDCSAEQSCSLCGEPLRDASTSPGFLQMCNCPPVAELVINWLKNRLHCLVSSFETIIRALNFVKERR